ncbi:hypothetical protein BWI75_25110 [Gloeocapsopsis sp. AAB1 = 1H9]|uniref:Uncharacterized protein n=1 Tax=Gloeocapsopsis dulcis AAB1 = 1H9 TaxID=1433147 RepID=A0A6N8G231_9CHRO|nr:hypothetical protein [Gloeocapsopsis dulcis AAB1 = 1H9]
MTCISSEYLLNSLYTPTGNDRGIPIPPSEGSFITKSFRTGERLNFFYCTVSTRLKEQNYFECVPLQRQRVCSTDIEPLSFQEQLTAIKQNLSLTNSELAKVLDVSRTTLYKWMEGIEPHDTNRERVYTVYQLACYWRDLSASPLGIYVKQRNQQGYSLFHLMSQKSVPVDDVKELMAIVARRRDRGRTSQSLYEMRRDKLKKEVK